MEQKNNNTLMELFNYLKTHKIVTVGICFLLFVMFTVFCIQQYYDLKAMEKKNSKLESKKENKSLEVQSTSNKKSSLPTHEIVSENNASKNVYVPGASESDIISLTDYFYNQKSSGSSLIVNYFNDKDVAKNYFTNAVSSSVSEKQKDKNFSHYIYTFKYIPKGYKALFKNVSGDWKEVKPY